MPDAAARVEAPTEPDRDGSLAAKLAATPLLTQPITAVAWVTGGVESIFTVRLDTGPRDPSVPTACAWKYQIPSAMLVYCSSGSTSVL